MRPAYRPETCTTATRQDGRVEVHTLVYVEVAIYTPQPRRGAQRTHGKQSRGESQWCVDAAETAGALSVLPIALPAQAGYNGHYTEGEQAGIVVSQTTSSAILLCNHSQTCIPLPNIPG